MDYSTNNCLTSVGDGPDRAQSLPSPYPYLIFRNVADCEGRKSKKQWTCSTDKNAAPHRGMRESRSGCLPTWADKSSIEAMLLLTKSL